MWAAWLAGAVGLAAAVSVFLPPPAARTESLDDAIGVEPLSSSEPPVAAGASVVERLGPLLRRTNLMDATATARVVTGLEMLAAEGYSILQGRKVGVLTNHTGVFSDMRHEVDVAHASDQVNVVAVFGPEHGFRGTSQAGKSEGFTVDTATGLPVYDIYMKQGTGLKAIFQKAGIDTLVFDLQDIGVRFYTYIWTLYDCLVAAALCQLPVVVLDRPNPIGGNIVDGPLMTPSCATFVGRKSIALRHGMTIGELAQLFNAEYVPGDANGSKADLRVVKCKGWRRSMRWSQLGLLWVPPSPNVPTATTALVYAGMGLFEGTNVSEGRGTTLPFELVGAPWIDGSLAAALRAKGVPGAAFREAYFQPTFSKYEKQTVGGVQVFITDERLFDPLRTAIAVISCIRLLWPKKFAWRYDTGAGFWVDKLTGSDSVRKAIDSGMEESAVIASWQEDVTWFSAMRNRYLLYD
eukprot:jgi/Chlat1/1649/Chrsp127S01895